MRKDQVAEVREAGAKERIELQVENKKN